VRESDAHHHSPRPLHQSPYHDALRRHPVMRQVDAEGDARRGRVLRRHLQTDALEGHVVGGGGQALTVQGGSPGCVKAETVMSPPIVSAQFSTPNPPERATSSARNAGIGMQDSCTPPVCGRGRGA